VQSHLVEEVQGEYGPFSIAEWVVQRIWATGALELEGIETLSGRSLEVLDRGKWNTGAGPDFKGASFRINGTLVQGDVELHFHQEDWFAHGHHEDLHFDEVVLHLLVFPPMKEDPRLTERGIESWAMLEALPQSLEAYAQEALLEKLSGNADTELMLTEWSSMPLSERKARIYEAARLRWEGKCRFMEKRVDLLGWDEACHQSAMEILGYRFNRSAMLWIAGDYSLRALVQGQVSVDELYEAGVGHWNLGRLRPANHPRKRLAQYLQWVERVPDWPEKLKASMRGGKWCSRYQEVGLSRKKMGIPVIKQQLVREVVGDALSGNRLDTLICDGLLPLGSLYSDADGFSVWYHWYVGDMPDRLTPLLKKLGLLDLPGSYACHGFYQGLLQHLLNPSKPEITGT